VSQLSGAVVCDLDGTLVDSAPGLRFAVNQLLAEEGRRPLALADVIPMIGDGATQLVHRAFAATGAPAEAEELNELVTRFHDHYEEVALRLTTPYPRVAETLQRLRDDGFSLSVCTNKLHRLAKLVLVGLDLARHFDVVIGGGSVAARKPDPRPLLAALEGLGAERGSAVMVGDGRNDVLTARRAGMAVVVVSYGYNGGVLPEHLGADAAIDDFSELLKILPRFLLRSEVARSRSPDGVRDRLAAP
jgi:phosphoglycolate phosphatase